MSRPLPSFSTDEAADAFLDQDWSDLDRSAFRPMQLRFSDGVVVPLDDELRSAGQRAADAAGQPLERYLAHVLRTALIPG